MNAESGLCVDAYGNVGPFVGMYECSGAANQQWTINTASGTITSHIPGSPCLTYLNSSELVGYQYQNATSTIVFVVNLLSADANVEFQGVALSVPGTSVTLFADGAAIFNTATVNTANLPSQRVYLVCSTEMEA